MGRIARILSFPAPIWNNRPFVAGHKPEFSRRAITVLAMGGLASACFPAKQKDLVKGESGRVVQIRDGDTLILDTGLTVRLAAIEAPRRRDPHGPESADLLEQLALGRRAQLFYGGLTRDRYDRAIAHVVVTDETGAAIWLNGYVVHQGAARVRSWADNAARTPDLLVLETEARSVGAGLWVHADYAVLTPEQFKTRIRRGLTLVEGPIASVQAPDQVEGWCRAHAEGLAIMPGLLMSRSPNQTELQAGQQVRIRGGLRIDDEIGSYIQLDHWAQIELLG